MKTVTPDPASVSAVIVNWNGGEMLLECLRSLRRQARVPDEVIVVDNASEDGSIEQAMRSFPEIHVLRNAANLGYGAGVNRGVQAARGEWIALLNNDAVAEAGWLAEMLAVAAADPEVGMVACKIYLDRGQRIIDKVGHRIAIDGQNFGRGHGCVDDGRYDGLTTVAWPDGCAGLWRRSAVCAVGGMDEQFFAYADDADLGIRVRLAGWRCRLAPRAVVDHRHSQSLGAYSARKLYLVERNRIWLAAKYFPLPLLALNPVLWLWRALLTLTASRTDAGLWRKVRPEERQAVRWAVVRAQVHGWFGVPRQLGKRRLMGGRCGVGWQGRFRSLLREARVPLADIAHERVA